MTTKKYLICPSHIRSKNDGDRHYISSVELMHLYGVSYKDCDIMSENHDYWDNPHRYPGIFDKYEAILSPNYHGEYNLQKEVERWQKR